MKGIVGFDFLFSFLFILDMSTNVQRIVTIFLLS